MMQEIYKIIDKNFIKVDILDGVKRVIDLFYEKDIECFAVYDRQQIVGVLTKKELISCHPNRIAADAMSDRYRCVNSSTPFWTIKEILDCQNIDVVFVEEKGEIEGFLTKTAMNIELGKHIDLLTGLYKSDYIFYNSYSLIKKDQEMSAIFIDLNHFGFIDKKYGHIYGDEILKDVAKVLKENIVQDMYLCRFGGDEFVILAPYYIEKCKAFSEKLVDAIEEYEFLDNIPVSISIGIAGCNVHNRKISDIHSIVYKLINIASLASTEAKNSSENIIVAGTLDMDAIA